MRPAAVIVLAAGAGTRVHSALPKVLHGVCGQAMLDHALAAARAVDPAELAVVVGHQREQVTAHLAEHAPGVQTVVQPYPGGTGHAVRVALDGLGLDRGTVVVTYGDVPALHGSTLSAVVREHDARQAAASSAIGAPARAVAATRSAPRPSRWRCPPSRSPGNRDRQERPGCPPAPGILSPRKLPGKIGTYREDEGSCLPPLSKCVPRPGRSRCDVAGTTAALD